MRPSGRYAVAGALLVVLACVAVRVWYHNTRTGDFWDDAREGECIASITFGALQQMQTGDYPRTPTVNCDDPQANYVIAAHTTEISKIQCPDGDKDVAMVARIQIKNDNGRRTTTHYGFGWMCAAPLLHEGRCYAPSDDRGVQVRSADCNAWSWLVTRRIDGSSDIHRCDPATGLVLSAPAVTYCEIVAPLPPELRDNRIARSLHPTPPPAG
jgi:hypothetical protein